MKTRKLLSVLLFLATASASGQSALPPVYEIKTDTPVAKLPDSYWQMLEDTNGKWTINNVTRPPIANIFHPNSTKQTGFGFNNTRYYWQRLRLKNETGKELKLVFNNIPWVDRYDFYVFRSSGKTEHFASGAYVPWSERQGLKWDAASTLTIENGEEVFLYKQLFIKRADAAHELQIGYTQIGYWLKQNVTGIPWYLGDVRDWLIAGVLIFGFFINLFFFFIVREKVYFYLALMLLTEGFWYLTRNNLFLRDIPVFESYFSIIDVLFTFTAIQFVRYFLKTYKHYPRWDKVLVVLFWLMAVYNLLERSDFFRNYFTRNLSYSAWFISGMFFSGTMFSLLLSFVIFRKEKDRLSNLSVIAALPAFVVWGFGYTITNLTSFLVGLYKYTAPAAVQWYQRNDRVIELFCVGWFAILFTWILLQRYSLLRKQYTQQALDREKERSELMQQQKIQLENQVEERTGELKKSIEELKATQHQLIQSEKMASLGELTAGIAHEIQNPLNFVNNFSEVNKELIDELQQELKTGKIDDAISISNDIKENEQKINHHGKRADAIVKGMLQHSRSSSGVKEPTDINALCDEYLRLSYHGLRAKDKSFNATIKTDFDVSLEKINIITQDVGRVILNLLTNAFYVVNEKQKQNILGYEPTVSVCTKKMKDKVEIKVADNGNGIPQKVMDKIFQPFFTTKPSGQGTGLGLSLSYDIVTKGHGGEFKVETKEGEGTSFIIILPT